MNSTDQYGLDKQAQPQSTDIIHTCRYVRVSGREILEVVTVEEVRSFLGGAARRDSAVLN